MYTRLCHSSLRLLRGHNAWTSGLQALADGESPRQRLEVLCGGGGNVAVSSSQSLGLSLGVRVEIPFPGVSSSSDLRVMAHIAHIAHLVLPLTCQSPFISVPCDS